MPHNLVSNFPVIFAFYMPLILNSLYFQCLLFVPIFVGEKSVTLFWAFISTGLILRNDKKHFDLILEFLICFRFINYLKIGCLNEFTCELFSKPYFRFLFTCKV